MKNFSKRLKTARESRKMTQTELAEILGFKQNSYTRIESGNHNVKMSNIYNFCKALNISADWLLGLDDYNAEREKLKGIEAIYVEIPEEKNKLKINIQKSSSNR